MDNPPTYNEQSHPSPKLKSDQDVLNEELRTIIDNSMDAFFLTAPDGKIFFANQAACELLQMTLEEIIAGGRDAIVDTDDPRLPQALEERLKTGKFRGELNLKKKDGTIFPGEVSAAIFSDSQGQQMSSIVVRDISVQKRLKADLAASELWMRCIFNSLEEGVFVVSTDRALVNINSASERIFGYTKEELKGRSTEILHIDSKHYEEFGKIISDAFADNQTARLEFKLKRKDGSVFPSEHTVSLLKDENGKSIGIVSVIRDISEQKQKEQEREKLIFDLQTALEEIKKLSGLIPICSICKNIRKDDGYWDKLESYIQEHSEVEFSHGICPSCAKKHYPDFDLFDD